MNSSESTAGATRASRELASRESDGVHVLLLWHPKEDAVTVSVDDSRGGRCFELAVDRRKALDAFYHPFAYAA
jgi:hypothetical protein